MCNYNIIYESLFPNTKFVIPAKFVWPQNPIINKFKITN